MKYGYTAHMEYIGCNETFNYGSPKLYNTKEEAWNAIKEEMKNNIDELYEDYGEDMFQAPEPKRRGDTLQFRDGDHDFQITLMQFAA